MKKIFALIIALTLFVFLCACEKSNEPSSGLTGIGSSDTTDAVFDRTEPTQQSEQKKHQEFVETYLIYAEKGAVVTWFDINTGEFSYKGKCELCGTMQNGETSGQRLGNGGSLNAGYVCTNSNCSMWGKSQPAVIKCSVTGEWVEVYD